MLRLLRGRLPVEQLLLHHMLLEVVLLQHLLLQQRLLLGVVLLASCPARTSNGVLLSSSRPGTGARAPAALLLHDHLSLQLGQMCLRRPNLFH